MVKWIAHLLGFKIAMIRLCNGKGNIQGDIELMKYVDFTGYTFKQEPMKRTNKYEKCQS